MRYAAFTVDVDRDANEPREGTVEAGCRGGPSLRFSSTQEGLLLLLDLLQELGIRGTFFLEGETAERLAEQVDLKRMLERHEVAAHGYAHEDLTGESTGITPSREWVDAIIGRSAASIEDITGRRPRGFRAPYQHMNDLVVQVLSERGFRYDSTMFADVGELGPRPLTCSLIEVPLAQGRDAKGRKMQSYLWPLHEGKRPASDYHFLFDQYDKGIMVLADHSWHIAEGLGGLRNKNAVEKEVTKVREVLQGALDQGIEFMTLEEHVRTEARR